MGHDLHTGGQGPGRESREAQDFPGPRLVEPIPHLAPLPSSAVADATPTPTPTPTSTQRRDDARAGGGQVLARRKAAGLTTTKVDGVVGRVAHSRVSVLITGETGAGKEVLAQRLHDGSPRAMKPLISINCAAVCGSLIDSELFGYQRGAFTGAEQSKLGLIEAADGGTLFLDEVGELSLTAQAKLLRVIETRSVLRVGAVNPRLVDVRFIAATNRDLDAAVAQGTFREDLLFRLEGIRLVVPPLRNRVDEILPAARRFLDEATRRDGLPTVPVLSEGAERALQGHLWPGNFRELRNVVECAAVICGDGRIEAEHLLLSSADERADERASSTEDGSAERDRILSALSACAGNQTRAAGLLGISRRTMVTRLETLGIPRPRSRRLRALPATRDAVGT